MCFWAVSNRKNSSDFSMSYLYSGWSKPFKPLFPIHVLQNGTMRTQLYSIYKVCFQKILQSILTMEWIKCLKFQRKLWGWSGIVISLKPTLNSFMPFVLYLLFWCFKSLFWDQHSQVQLTKWFHDWLNSFPLGGESNGHNRKTAGFIIWNMDFTCVDLVATSIWLSKSITYFFFNSLIWS